MKKIFLAQNLKYLKAKWMAIIHSGQKNKTYFKNKNFGDL